MKDKEFTKFAFIALGIALLWWLWQRRVANMPSEPETEAPTMTPNDPQLITYSQNPSAFNPPSLGNININIANQGLSYLSNQYVPLFGFVGMAQGVSYQ
jgi:hypothetical protein